VVVRKKFLVLFLQDMALRLLGVVFVAPCLWLVVGSSLANNDDRRLEIDSDSHFVADKSRLVRREGDKPEDTRAGLENDPSFIPVEPPDAGASHNVTCMACNYPWINKDGETVQYCPVMIQDEATCSAGTDIGNETDVGNCSTKVLNAGAMFFMFGREGTPHAFECRTASTTSDGSCVAAGCCAQGISENPNYDYYKIEPKTLRPLYNDLIKMRGKADGVADVAVQEALQDQAHHRDMMESDICSAEAASVARAKGYTEAQIKEKQQEQQRIEQMMEQRFEDKRHMESMRERNEGGSP